MKYAKNCNIEYSQIEVYARSFGFRPKQQSGGLCLICFSVES